MDKFNRQIQNRLRPELEKIGFSNFKESGTMSFEDGNIIDFIWFGGVHNLVFEHYQAGIGEYYREVKIISSFIKDIEESVNYKLTSDSFPISNVSLNLSSNNNNLSKFEEKGIGNDYKSIAEAFSIKILENFQTILFPLIEQRSNIHALDEVYNTPFDKKSFSYRWMNKLIVAKLAGNTQYHDIHEYVSALFKNIEKNASTKEKAMKFGKWVEMIQEVDNRLKATQPLKDPYLGSINLRNRVLGVDKEQ